MSNWKEEFRKKFKFEQLLENIGINKSTIKWLSSWLNKRDDEIINFISNLRQKDKDELIKMLTKNCEPRIITDDGDSREIREEYLSEEQEITNDCLNKTRQLIQDYFNK